MKDKKNSRSDYSTVIIIDREYIENDVRNREKGLLNRCGKLNEKTFDLLRDEIINHTSGFLGGCYLNVHFRVTEEKIRNRKTMRFNR